MLRQRVITAVVLLVLLLPTLMVAHAGPFAWLTLALVAAGAWEWARLNGTTATAAAVASGVLMAVLGVLTLMALPPLGDGAPWWWLAALAWTVGAGLALRAGPLAWPRLPPAARWAVGFGLLWLAWLALVQARVVGVHFLISTLCIVWMADIAAYFSGRAFGRRKLAPSISPGKSWEGVAGGLIGVGVMAMLWLAFEDRWPTDSPSVFRLVLQRHGEIGLVLALLWLTALGVMGDLVESMAKRAAGVKDSSGLLPGHGGVLDRVDALLPVLPAAMALISV